MDRVDDDQGVPRRPGENRRNKVIVPDSAHGTNPASATVAGFEAVTVKSDENGLVSVEDLKQVVGRTPPP